MLLMAAIQMVSTPQLASNLAQAAELLAEAAAHGAQLAVLPENFALMARQEHEHLAVQETLGTGPIQDFLATQAAQHGLWLVGGTIGVRSAGERMRSTCLLFNNHGMRIARYDKVHLFNAQVPGREERYAESATIEPGTQYTLAVTPWGGLGLGVCYDLRFPEQFRALAAGGMEILALPAAFTATTGAAHWETLLRCRAIENQCYVLAAGQGGRHSNGRETFGNSMIIDPWGVVVERLDWGPGVVVGRMDAQFLREIRQQFPALQHRVDNYAVCRSGQD